MPGDQATHLRRLAGQEAPPPPALQLPALAITGGKGGVGKTSLAVNLALLLARQQLDPLLIDLDLGLANADVLLGVNPHTTLFEVVLGNTPLQEALIDLGQGCGFIPAASGRDELTHLRSRQFALLLKQLQQLGRQRLLLLDTMAGISAEVLTFLRHSRLVLVVLTPDPTSLTDAYALIKVLEQQQAGKDIRVLVNQVGSEDEAHTTYARLRKVCQSYLGRDLAYLGHVPRDRHVADAVRRREPFVRHPDAPASRALRAIAMRLKAIEWHTG